MPIYNPPLGEINADEVRRYAGLRQSPFDPQLIQEACDGAQLLAMPKGNYEIYEYDELTGTADGGKLVLEGSSIRRHLVGCCRLVVMTVSVGGDIEQAVTESFAAGRYAYSVLLDAAATQAVEQTADAMEKEIGRLAERMGMVPRWRFSPGYGDWPLTAQRDIVRYAGCEKIGVSLTESLMLLPRKSVTAVIGLGLRTEECRKREHNCSECDKLDCPARRC